MGVHATVVPVVFADSIGTRYVITEQQETLEVLAKNYQGFIS